MDSEEDAQSLLEDLPLAATSDFITIIQPDFAVDGPARDAPEQRTFNLEAAHNLASTWPGVGEPEHTRLHPDLSEVLSPGDAHQQQLVNNPEPQALQAQPPFSQPGRTAQPGSPDATMHLASKLAWSARLAELALTDALPQQVLAAAAAAALTGSPAAAQRNFMSHMASAHMNSRDASPSRMAPEGYMSMSVLPGTHGPRNETGPYDGHAPASNLHIPNQPSQQHIPESGPQQQLLARGFTSLGPNNMWVSEGMLMDSPMPRYNTSSLDPPHHTSSGYPEQMNAPEYATQAHAPVYRPTQDSASVYDIRPQTSSHLQQYNPTFPPYQPQYVPQPTISSPRSPRDDVPRMQKSGIYLEDHEYAHPVQVAQSPDQAPGAGFRNSREGLVRGRRGSRMRASAGAVGMPSAAEVDRLQAQVASLDSLNQELTKRVAELSAQLEHARDTEQKLIDTEQSMKDSLAQADVRLKSKEQQLHISEQQVSALTGEVQSLRAALSQEQAARQAAVDDVSRWKGEHQYLHKEMDDTVRKLNLIGGEERKLQGELQHMRKEFDALSDAYAKMKVELQDARDRGRQSHAEADHHASLAANAKLQAEGLTAVNVTLRDKIAELESRQATLQEEIRMLRQSHHSSHAAGGPATSSYQQNYHATSPNKEQHYLDMRPAGVSKQEQIAASTTRGLLPGPGAGRYSPNQEENNRNAYDAQLYDSNDAGRRDIGSRYDPNPDAGGLRPYSRASRNVQYEPELRNESSFNVAPSRGDDYGSFVPSRLAEQVRSSVQTQAAAAGYRPQQQAPSLNEWGEARSSGQSHSPRMYDVPSRAPYPAPGYDRDYGRVERYQVNNARPYMDAPQQGRPYQNEDREDPQARPAQRRSPYGVQDEYADRRGLLRYSDDDVRGSSDARKPLYSSTTYLPESQLAAAAESKASQYQYGAAAKDGSAGNAAAQQYGGPRPVSPYAGNPGMSALEAARKLLGSGGEPGRAPPRSASPPLGRPASPGVSSPDPGMAYKTGLDVPFATERTLKELLAKSQAMEGQLVTLCAEKTQLDSEYSKMPLHGGRNSKVRARKVEIETRMEEVQKDISALRLALKKLHGK